MFHLTTVPARYGRHLLVGLLSPAVHVPVSLTTRRTLKNKAKLRPNPRIKQAMTPDMLPTEVSAAPRSLSEFQIRIKDLDMKHVTAQEAHDMYTKYMKAVAAKQRPAGWQEKFAIDTNASAAKLHETATLVLTLQSLRGSEFEFSCTMLRAAAGLGDDAAALSLGRILQRPRTRQDYFHWDQPWWRQARYRCMALIKEGRDANALVLKGLIHLKRNNPLDDSLALEAFVQAETVGKRADRFDWEPTCLEGQGNAHQRLNQKKQAEEAFRRLADLDCARGFYRLARLFPRSESTLDWLTKAAASGLSETYQLLVDEHERLRSICMNQGREKEARRHERDAAEWTLVMRAQATRDKELNTATESTRSQLL
ncbi:uncharacterized protein LY79DRAFT_671729 [Colletotrichum navitas]|uniref:Uncharacterized protein n=1 Tax=Colletotrichum navitas TaxID=681940 RepID=A0AAD8V0Q1_9PEZI|nr:uncharacterized protein LY79DRAFT_671729 [Colletotrichum navitas]KAK1580490.1 hypothetical protein LY79DRAFT_671729 [Colletotrichum navitas]